MMKNISKTQKATKKASKKLMSQKPEKLNILASSMSDRCNQLTKF